MSCRCVGEREGKRDVLPYTQFFTYNGRYKVVAHFARRQNICFHPPRHEPPRGPYAGQHLNQGGRAIRSGIPEMSHFSTGSASKFPPCYIDLAIYLHISQNEQKEERYVKNYLFNFHFKKIFEHSCTVRDAVWFAR